MNPNKAFRKFGDACMRAPEGANFTVGLTWVQVKGWRVMMMVHTHCLMLGTKDARNLAAIYDKHHQEPEWRGKTTGLEWVSPELRKMADEADQKNRDKILPDDAAEHLPSAGTA